MLRRWRDALIVGALAAVATYPVALALTPFALMRLVERRAPPGAYGQFLHSPMTTAANQTIVRPSPDLAYSLCTFDLARSGIMRVRVEPVPGRYWSVSVYDARTDVAAVRSDRDTGGRAAQLEIVGSRYTGPITPGYERVPLDYERGVVLLRVLTTGPADFSKVDALRRRSRCEPVYAAD